MLSGGLPSLSLLIAADKLPAINLRPGQTLQGVVQAGEGGGLSVRTAGVSIPLDGTALTPGQSVTIEAATDVQGKLQLRITPHGDVVATRGAVPVIAGALGALAQFQTLAPSIPPFLAPRDTWLRQLAAAWFGRSGDSDDSDSWRALLQSARATGWNPPPGLADMLAEGDTPEPWLQLLRALGPRNLTEGKFAAALARGDEGLLAEEADIRTVIARLFSDPALRAALAEGGKLETFDTLNRTLLDRLDRAALANTLALEGRYAYIDLPAHGMRHARVHWFGGKGEKGEPAGKPEYGFAALDIELSQLGPMWITLRRTRAGCECGLRAVNDDAIRLIRGERAELAGGLQAAGYTRPKIIVGRWHGDALRSLTEAFEETHHGR
jgi:hypothetical protein